MGLQYFFVGKEMLGSRQIEDTRCVPGLEVRMHYSFAFCCMRCGEIWGRLLHDKAKMTQFIIRPCQKHGDGRLSCPDTWYDEPMRLEINWPERALIHEFEAHAAILGAGDTSASPGVTFN